MLDYADPHMLHISEIPANLDEQAHVVKKYGNVLVRCEPVQIVRDGEWAGVWRVTRLWTRDGLLGYVRFDLDNLFVHMRPGLWHNEEMIARWDISQAGGFTSGLVAACETLLLYRMSELSHASALCGMSNPYRPESLCTSLSGHEVNEPAHVDEHGSVWYWEDYLLVP